MLSLFTDFSNILKIFAVMLAAYLLGSLNIAIIVTKIFTGKDVVYVFHNQIDTRGDTQNTEDEVFTACKEAVTEIYDIIKRISSNGNTHRFIITSDHGFIYRRDKLSESDKIDIQTDKDLRTNRRPCRRRHRTGGKST